MTRNTMEAPPTKELSPAVHLRAAVMAQRIYPSGNPIVERSVFQTKGAAERQLASVERLTLTDRQGRLFVNGQEDPDALVLAGVFREQGIQSLTLLPGVTDAEVSVLVRLLGRRADGRKFADRLAEENAVHIQADKVTVVEIEDGQMITRRINDLFEQTGDFTGLVGSLREAYDLIDRMPSLAEKEKAQDQVAGRIAAMPGHMIKDLFENPLPSRVEDSNLRDNVLKKMTSEKVHDIFSEIGQWYANIRKHASSDFEAMEKLGQLKKFLGRMLSVPASREVPFALYEELLHNGLIDAVPDGVKPQGEPSLADRVGKLLEGPASALLEKGSRETLPALFGKLCAVELFPQARALMARFLDNLDQDSAAVRALAVRTSRGILETLWQSRCPDLADHLHQSLRRLADRERSREAYAELADCLSFVAVRFLLSDRPVHALETLSLLRRHAEDPSPIMPSRADVSRTALDKTARDMMDVLTDEMLSHDPARAAVARNVLFGLGKSAAPCLWEVVKRASDQRARTAAAMSLKEMGEAGTRALALELTPALTGPALLNLLSVAGEFSSPVLTSALSAMRHYPDGFVRARLAQILGKIGTPDSLEAAAAMLQDKEEGVRLEAVKAIGEGRHAAAVPALARLLRSDAVPCREEACLALGRIGGDDVVPILAETAARRGGLFSMGADADETVRVRAVWALASVKTPLSRRELKKFQSDDNLQVRLIAQQPQEG